jgi:hypothetical protein
VSFDMQEPNGLTADSRDAPRPEQTSSEAKGSGGPGKGGTSTVLDTEENKDPNASSPKPRQRGNKEKVETQYSRRVAPTKKEREAEAVQRYIEKMKAHFRSVRLVRPQETKLLTKSPVWEGCLLTE